MSKNNAQHILNTSSNLLGFCLVVLTSLKITKFNETTLIDEFTGVASLLLAASALLSFLSIRTNESRLSNRYEIIADNVFVAALLMVFLITFMIAFSIVF